MPAVMVQGCTSSAGKSLVATALCRWYADRGLRVAPFKAQNMSNHARVAALWPGPDAPVPGWFGAAGTAGAGGTAGSAGARGDGGEIGVAQWLQARAARVAPDVRMNPVLVKPERAGSQVVRLGRVDAHVTGLPWTQRAASLWPSVVEALDSLLAEHDLVVCEGAGSPAEVNLRASDLANMPVARHAGAPVLLVVDIDRGGAFAHLLGTWTLLPDDDRRHLAAFVLNRFRGDPALLGDGPSTVVDATGMAHAGVLPMLDHDLPDEDAASLGTGVPDRPSSAPVVAVVRYPRASNLDELAAVHRAATVVWARRPGDLAGADLVLLPGSKDVAADLDWLRETGLADAVVQRVRDGQRVLGICGGCQMLGRRLDDLHGVEGDRGAWSRDGLGVLPVVTSFDSVKRVGTWHGRLPETLPRPWLPLAGVEVAGYDIRYGVTRPDAAAATDASGRVVAAGAVLGTVSHGLLERAAAVSAVTGTPAPDAGRLLDATIDRLARAVDEHLDTDLLARLPGAPL